MGWNRLVKAGFVLTIVFLSGQHGYTQVNRYMVHFTDKQNTSFRIDNPEAYLSARAIERRTKQGIAITEQDLPVKALYVNGLEDIGIKTFFTSKWFNSVLVECDAGAVPEIETLPYVASVEFVAPGSKITTKPVDVHYTISSTKRQKRRKTHGDVTSDQNKMLGLDVLHESGYTGQGKWVAIMDGGFFGANNSRFFSRLFVNNKVKYTYDFVTGQNDVFKYTEHGTRVFSLIGAYAEDEFIGSAYDADFFLFVTEDVCGVCEHRVEEYNWVFAAEFADSAGVDVINTSLGYNLFEDPAMTYSYDEMDGNTAVISIAASIASSRGMVVVTSAGNEGNLSWNFITAPADAHNIISVGNVNLDGIKSSSSSFGPSADGRIKPELVALGTGVKVVSSSGAITTGNGTSFSSALVAGLIATTWNAFPDLTADEIRIFYEISASNATSPDDEIGYGIPNFIAFDNLMQSDESDQDFIIYPNPVSGSQFIIRANNPDETSEVDIKIFDMNGKIQLKTTLYFSWLNNSQVIDFFTLRKGVYIINLDTGSEIIKLRVVKI